jgi:hypothetical protein
MFGRWKAVNTTSTEIKCNFSINEFTHSRAKTPSRQSGPSKVTFSNDAAVAFAGIHSDILVIIFAMLLIETRASSPLTMPRQLASPPPSPSGLHRDSWKSSRRTTGPSISSISLSGSKRWAKSWRNGSISEGLKIFGDGEADKRGAEKVDRERRGATSSGGPRGRLCCGVKS